MESNIDVGKKINAQDTPRKRQQNNPTITETALSSKIVE
jgi:hypothetical protein